ncbi:PQQ-binding-like beta-propeller repeat protein [Streptomyces sp. NPDC007100]|uniref:caspase, EACC1-associated type n=1 Tax=Streptomyces sp. NPDC007100 TaxID=3155602 RepID=UPI0033D8C2AF
MGRRLALLVATYEYQDEGLDRLTAPAHDAEALARVLRHPDIAGFDVTTLVNKKHDRVGEAIGELYRGRERGDLTLLYFTGHGLKDDEGRLYLAMTDTKRDNLAFSSVPAELIDQSMSSCWSRQKVLILDCCYSGAFPAGRLVKAGSEVHSLDRFQGRGRTVLTASDATRYAFEGDRVRGRRAPQSVFTRHLVQGLEDGSADLDGDGNITLDELYSYVYDKVVAEMPQQRPKRMDNVEGRIVIARNVHWQVPPYLRQSLRSPSLSERLRARDDLAFRYRTGNVFVRRRIEAEMRQLRRGDAPAAPAAPATAGFGEFVRRWRPARAAALLGRRDVLRYGAAGAGLFLLKADHHRPLPGAIRWQYATGGAVESSPAVSRGLLYVGSGDYCLYALDAATGRKRWKYTTGSAVHGSPAVANGSVYVGSYDGKLYAFDAAAGKKHWQYTTGSVPSSPAVADGLVYSGSYDGKLYAFAEATGTKRWQYDTPLSLPVISSPAVARGLVYIGCDDNELYAIDAAGGQKMWTFPTGGDVEATPVVAGSRIYAASGDGHLYALDAETGKRQWDFFVGNAVKSLSAVARGLVYIGGSNGGIYALDAAKGVKRWENGTGGAIGTAPVVTDDGTVCVGSNDGNLYLFDADNGRRRGRVTIGAAIRSSPAVANGLVHFGSDNGRVYAVDVRAAGDGA